MADRKISDLTALTAPAAGDYLPIVDISEVSAANKNKRITIEELLRGAPDGTAAAPSIGFENDPNTGIYSPGADALGLVTGATERLRITSAGLVGIGTTPVVDLDVAPAASTATFRIHARSNTTPVATIELVRGTNTTFGADGSGDYRIKNDTGNLSFEYGDSGVTTERARIDSSGRLLVGTSTARSNFAGNTATPLVQIEGVTAATASSSITRGAADATGPTFNLGKTRGASVGLHTVVASGDQCGVITFQGADGTNLIRAAQIAAEVDGTPGANDMPGRLVFSTTADGASTPTERMRITSDAYVRLASGSGGIQFNGDTAAANALDDYEEGTWTPTLNLSTTQYTAVSYNSWTKGHYRKVGSFVHIQGVLITNDIDFTAGAGNVRIGGLPFASPANASGENYTGTSSISIGFADSWTTAQPCTAEVISNSSIIALYTQDATGERTTLTTANVTDANFSNIIRFAGTYISV